MSVASWHPAPPPAVATLGIEIPVQAADAACGEAFRVSMAPQAHSVRLEATGPQVVSIPIGDVKLRARSFVFSASVERESPPAGASPQSLPPPPAAASLGLQGRTRIKPPGNVIKLADRLHYLLQPSLESLLAEGLLTMPFPPFPFQLEGAAFLYPRLSAILADENGLGQDDAGDYGDSPAASPRGSSPCAAGLSQAAGEQLAAGIRPLGPGNPPPGRRRRPGAAAVAVAIARRPAAHRQLRSPLSRSRSDGRRRRRRPRGGLRSGRPRRIAAGEKSGQRHQRGRLFTCAETQLGPDRHARGKQRRRPAGDFRVFGPGLSFAGDEAAAAGPGGERSRPPPHEGAGAGRPAAETLSRCGVGTDPAAARVLRIGGKRGRLAADGNGRRGNDPARLRVGAAVEADLQFRPRQRRQLETGADRGRFSRRWPPAAARRSFSANGSARSSDWRRDWRGLAPWRITAGFPTAAARRSFGVFATIPRRTSS